MSATNSSKGILKAELLASHVSARALHGVENIKILSARNTIAGKVRFLYSYERNNIDQMSKDAKRDDLLR